MNGLNQISKSLKKEAFENNIIKQKIDENNMQHGIDYCGQDITGWIATEKFDGCRVYWDGNSLWSRGGINIKIPYKWKKQLPKNIHLDRELYDGIDGVYRCGSAIRYGNFKSTMKLIVFDSPTLECDYLEKMNQLSKYESDILSICKSTVINNITEVDNMLDLIKRKGGEGIMLRKNDLRYNPGRTNKLLKYLYHYN